MSTSKHEAILGYFEALKRLQEERILINQHGFICQIGEWLVETIYDGKRSVNGVQEGWDVEAKGKFIQVKAHAKSKTNGANFSAISRESKNRIDLLVIIIFNSLYKIMDYYEVPWEIAKEHIKFSGKKNPREELNWSLIRTYKKDIKTLPRQDIISLFI